MKKKSLVRIGAVTRETRASVIIGFKEFGSDTLYRPMI